MDYMTLKEASEKWGVTPRWINYYCSAGRIPGAVKMGTVCFLMYCGNICSSKTYSQYGNYGNNQRIMMHSW